MTNKKPMEADCRGSHPSYFYSSFVIRHSSFPRSPPHPVLQRREAQAVDRDLNGVARFEGEVVGGDDAGAAQQDDAVGEGVVAAQVLDQVREGAVEAVRADLVA